MKIDLLHNAIIAKCATESFKEQISAAISAHFEEKYAGEVIGVQMYEDCLGKGFYDGRVFYYPLSVKTSLGVFAEWVCWTVKRGAFSGDNPFAFSGKGAIDFIFPDFVPSEFTDKHEAVYFDKPCAKIKIDTPAPDFGVLAGKYSQRFVDLLSEKIAPIVERAVSVCGIEESKIEFALVFAPETYMEHTSENVTYRRVLLCDSGSAPRDLWIKWTRLDGKCAYSMKDTPDPENILFELGEDVPQKIKEKEYRFLSGAGKDKYHNAMGRKHITEWREVVKRALKRGELSKAEGGALVCQAEDKNAISQSKALEDSSADQKEVLAVANALMDGAENEAAKIEETSAENIASAVQENDDLATVGAEQNSAATAKGSLGACSPENGASGKGATVISEDGFIEDEDDELANAMRMARLALDSIGGEDEGEGDEPAEAEEPQYADEPKFADEDKELDEIARMALEALALYRAQNEEAGKVGEDEDPASNDLDGLTAEEEAEEIAAADEENAEDILPKEEELEELEAEDAAEAEELLEAEADEGELEDSELYATKDLFALDGEDGTDDEDLAEELEEIELETEEETEEEDKPEDTGASSVIVPDDPTEEEYIEDEDGELYLEGLRDARALEPDGDDADISAYSDKDNARGGSETKQSKDFMNDKKETADIAKIREEIEAKIRLEYESRARQRAEEEAERLRYERELLRKENERLIEKARKEAEERQLAEENHKNETEQLRAQIEAGLRREAKEKERIAEAARYAVEEQQRLELERLKAERIRLEDERARREAEAKAEAERLAEQKRLEEERAKKAAEAAAASAPMKKYTFTTKVVSLIFRKSVDPNLISRIEATIKATLEYLGKQNVPMKIKATIPSSNMVRLEFREFPEQEMELLGSIVKIMGNNNLGIAKAIIE